MGDVRPAYASLPEWQRISGMSRTVTYERLGLGVLRAIKVGKKTLIDVEHGLAWMAAQPPAVIRAPAKKNCEAPK